MSMKNKFNKVLSDFSSVEKVLLYNFLYEELSGKGICGDTELAHVNKHEMAVLRSMGGAGTINENTKCVQFFGSPPPAPPRVVTQQQSREIPAEIKPYVQEVLTEAQDIYQTRKGEGYLPFPGQQIAPFSPEQEAAYQLTADQVGQTASFTTPAAQLAGLAALGPSDAEVARYMNPYAAQVIDRTERERRRAAEQERQAAAARAVRAGAFGGSREAILEAERRRNLEQSIADIRAGGLAAAYDNALKQAQAQRRTQLDASRNLTTLGQVAPAGSAQEAARLEAVGAARQQQAQAELDIGQRRFLEERTFPERTLTQYSQFIQPTQGALGAAGTLTQTTPGAARPTYLQQGLQAVGTGLQVASMFPGFPSDPKIKTDISKIGMDDATGLAMYSFRYKDDPKTYPKVIGPMSTEVKEKYPELVSEVDGIEVVDFGGLASIANTNKEKDTVELKSGGLVSLANGGIIPSIGSGLDLTNEDVLDEEEELDVDDISDEDVKTSKPKKEDKGFFANLFERPKLSTSNLLKGKSTADKLGIILSRAGGEEQKEGDTAISALLRGASKGAKDIKDEELKNLSLAAKIAKDKGKFNTAALEILRKQVADRYRAMYDEKGNLVSADGKTPLDATRAAEITAASNNALKIFSRLVATGKVSDAKAFEMALGSVPTVEVNPALSDDDNQNKNRQKNIPGDLPIPKGANLSKVY